MSLADHVQVTVRRVRSPAAKEGFGTMMALDAHRLWEDRYRSFASLAELEDAGATAHDTLHRLATVYFGQANSPTALGVGRLDCGDNVWVEIDDLASELPYDLTIAGLLHRIVSAPNATEELVAGKLVTQINGGYEITAVAVGPAGVFTIAGNHLDEFAAGQTFTVAGSTGNNAGYTVASVALNAGNTEITITSAAPLPSAVADGHIGGYAVTACVAGASGTFTTPGDVRDRFPDGLKFGISGSTNNDNRTGSGTSMDGIPYEVASTTVAGGNTVITIATTGGAVIPGALGANGGGIVSWADGDSATSTVVADILSYDIAAVVAGPGGTFAFPGDATSLFPAGTQFRVSGATVAANNRLWTVGASTYTAPNTVVTVVATQTVTADAGATGNVSLPILRTAPEDANQFYTVAASDRLHLRFAVSAVDLTDVRNADDNWYAVMVTSRSSLATSMLAAAVEAITDAPKIAGFGSGDDRIVDDDVTADSPVTGSIAARLAGLNYARSFVVYSGDGAGEDGVGHKVWSGFSEGETDDDPFVEAAIFGKMLPSLPGSSTYNLQELTGILADDLTGTQRTNALAKNANIYAAVTDTSDGFQSGTTAQPEWIDIMAGLDWLKWDIETRLYNRLWSESNAGRKVPYTDAGAATLEGEIRASVDLAISRNVIASDPAPVFVTPPVASQSAADRAARRFAGMQVRCTAAGAIHVVGLTVEVEV